MDENPLVGEPGSFILSRAGDVDRSFTSATSSAAATTKQVPSAATATGTVNTPKVSTPQVRVDTPGKVSVDTPISEEKKRRKNKIGG